MTDPMVGTQLGNYSIESVLGQGGMGVVYLAFDTALERRVALKVLSPAFAQDDSFNERFMRESRIAASLDHPNVVPIYDAGQQDGRLYIAMRYVAGTDLKKLISAEQPLEPSRVCRLMSQVASALDAAHAASLVHRDVKPANILVTRFGESAHGEHAYLSDFGITKRSGSQSALTQTGSFVGTIDYMAPEQIEGKGGDARADVYSLGCVAFEALSGKPPFEKDTDVAVMYAHLMDERPSLRDGRPELGTDVDEVVKRAMARDPAERFGSAGEFAEELSALIGVPAGTTGAATVRRAASASSRTGPIPGGRRTLVAGAALVVVAIAAFILTRSPADETGQTPTGSSAAAGVVAPPTGDDGGAGTESDPFATLQKAVDEAGEGGTVTLEDGVYQAGGAPLAKVDRPVTIEAADGASPILRGAGRSGQGIVVSPGIDGVTVRGLTFEGLAVPFKVSCDTCKKQVENRNIVLERVSITDSENGVIVENAEHVSLIEVAVEDTVNPGFMCNPGPCDQVEITKSSFLDATGPESDGIQVVLSDGVVVEDTVVSGNGNDGLDVAADFLRISRTEVRDNEAAGLWMWESEVSISDSLFANNGAQGLSVCPEGCVVGTFSAGNILVTGNGSRTGDDAISIAANLPSDVTFELFNSLVTENEGVPIVLGSKVAIARIDYNLVDVISENSPAVEWKGKVYTGDDLNHSRLPGSIDGGTYMSRPLFVAADDYHLRPNSPGVDGGTEVGMSDSDLDGTPRPQGKAPDQGPYEQ